MIAKALPRALLLGSFLLLIFSAKLCFINESSHALPTWDQWDSECEIVLRPWLEGRLTADNIFVPHVEHRIVPTKLTVLGLLIANGQWDGLVETTFNALIHTLSALVLLLLARRWLKGNWLVGFGVLVTSLFSLPFGWQNTLIGFQSPFYYLLLFSLLHMALVLEEDSFSWRWSCGLVAGALAVVSMASGFLGSAAVLLVLSHRLVRERRWTAQQTVTATVALILCIAGWQLKTSVPGHEFLKVRSVGKFVSNVLLLLSWPCSSLSPWTLFVSAPAVVFVYRRVKETTFSPANRVLLALLAWTGLQICSISYSRGGEGSVLTSRYLDLLVINIALGWVFIVREFSGRLRQWIAFAWFAAVVIGLYQQSSFQWREEIVPEMARREHQEENVRAYLRTDDPAHLRDKPFAEIPYPDADTLISRLSHANVRNILPWTVRKSVSLAANEQTRLTVPIELPPAPAPLALSTWSPSTTAQAPISWRSARQSASSFNVLRFRVAGDLGARGKALRLVVKSDQGEVAVEPASAPGNRWKTVTVIRPRGEWWIEATDNEPDAWFAFTEPVELSHGSYYVGEALKLYLILVLTALILLIACFWSEIRRLGDYLFRRDAHTRAPATQRNRYLFTTLGTFMVVALAAVTLTRFGVIYPVKATHLANSIAGPDWLALVPRNYSWFTCAVVAIGTLLFLPGVALRRGWARFRTANTVFFALPGLGALVVIGWLAWLSPVLGACVATLWLILNLLLAVELTRTWWIYGAVLPSGVITSLCVYALVCVSALAFGVLPLPVAQEFGARSTSQSRMIASPPDHGIPFSSAVYFYLGHNGKTENADYFGQDWSIASRGPIAPFAINALFHVFGARPRPFAGTSLEAWPASADGYYLARIFMILANALVLLAGAELSKALAPNSRFVSQTALIWLAAAPVVMINIDFTWPKMLASALFLLAAKAVIERRPAWLAGMLAGLAYLTHPVGALFTPMLVLFGMHQMWRETEPPANRARSAIRTALWITAGWLLCATPWLAFKTHLGFPDAFTRYPFGDGRGPLAAESLGSWLNCRWSNLWYSITPGGFFCSNNMKSWIEGPVSEPMRWAVYYAKTLPAGLGHGLFFAAIWAFVKPTTLGLPVGFRRWLLTGSFATILILWGFSGDGLGRNCLEPLVLLVIIYAAAAKDWPRWLVGSLAALSLAEAFSVRVIGIVEGGAGFPCTAEILALTAICLLAGVGAVFMASNTTLLTNNSAGHRMKA